MEEMTGSCLRGLRTRVWRTVKMFMIHCAEEIANMCIHMCVCERVCVCVCVCEHFMCVLSSAYDFQASHGEWKISMMTR